MRAIKDSHPAFVETEKQAGAVYNLSSEFAERRVEPFTDANAR